MVIYGSTVSSPARSGAEDWPQTYIRAFCTLETTSGKTILLVTIFPPNCIEFSDNSLNFPGSENSLNIPGFPGLFVTTPEEASYCNICGFFYHSALMQAAAAAADAACFPQ